MAFFRHSLIRNDLKPTLMPSGERPFSPSLFRLLAALAWAWFATPAFAAPDQEPYFLATDPKDAPRRIVEALDVWDTTRARAELDAVRGDKINPSLAIYLDARIAFLDGDYERADDLLSELDRKGVVESEKVLRHFREFVARTRKETKDFESRESEHFRFFYPPGPERILADDALIGLERQYEALSEVFGIQPDRKIRVEVAPSGRAFVALSDIEQKAVETTGTIALCKYNRLIITSPRALPRGYPWRDTLGHELVHYFVYKRTDNTTPVWLHEGIAKYFENAWRGGPLGELSPSQETLLLNALKGSKIIPLARMHPSFVYLDSAEEGSQAFAQVNSVIEFVHKQLGEGNYDLLNKILDNLTAGAEYEQAFAEATGMPFETFYQRWLDYLKTKPLRLLRHTHIAEVRFVESEEMLEKQEIESIDSEKVRDLIRVGDLLKNRGRFAGAAEEYAKALAEFGANPIVLNKLVYAQLQSGRLEEAKKNIDLAVENFPEYGTIYKRLGEFYSLKQDWPQAAKSLERALDINPFDVEVRRLISAVYAQLGDEAGVRRQQEALKFLGAG